MSRRLATEIFRVVRGMKPAHKYVFQCLAWHWNDHEDKYGKCDPGEDLMAEETGYTPRQVVNIIAELVALGRVAKKTKRGRFHHCNDYDLFMTRQEILDLGCSEDEITDETSDESTDETGDGKCKDCTIESEKISLLNLKKFHFPWCKDFTFESEKISSKHIKQEHETVERENTKTETGTPSQSRPRLLTEDDEELANQIAVRLEPGLEHHGKSVKKLLAFFGSATQAQRDTLRSALEDSLVMLKLNNMASSSPVGYLIRAVREGFISEWFQSAEEARAELDKRRQHPQAAAPPEGDRQDDDDFDFGKPIPTGKLPDDETVGEAVETFDDPAARRPPQPAAVPPPPKPVEPPKPPKPKKCVVFDESCYCPDCSEFRSKRAFIMEDQHTWKDIAHQFAGEKWKEFGQSDKAGHEGVEARYQAWKAKQASAA